MQPYAAASKVPKESFAMLNATGPIALASTVTAVFNPLISPRCNAPY